ncbi:MAG: aldehyde ferredoxin oxidoreductase family protein [Candidatus Lokiarchaeota archaeon]|nr:aldehyde ferredoxin oxidoreductase family protein [Candidatus Lokiarchaeota archaeon]
MSKILRINLSNKDISQEETSAEDESKFIGGIGLSTAIFTREVSSDVDPLGEENLLILSVGQFCGTAIPFCGRHFLMAKSPLTNILGEASSGGFFGKELKSTGFDYVIIKGKSETPVLLSINDGKAEILDATELWGKGTQDTDKVVKEKLGDPKVRVATIGPAGENLVKYACIINDKTHAAGRCGLGAVMGSKKLKAIAVRGTEKVPVNDKEKVLNAAKELRDLLSKSALGMVMSDSGTPVHLDSMASVGDINVKNWTEGRWIGVKQIGAKALNARGEVKMHGCFNCPTACRGYVEYEGEWVSRPEYETLGMLGSNLLVDDLEALIKLNLLVNDLGLDSISLGGVLGCLLESIDRELLPSEYKQLGFKKEQVWGDSKTIEKIIPMIAYREGVGNKLAEGVKKFCEIEELPEELSIHGKGLEIPAHEPRANNLTALDYATTPRGAYHCYEPMHLSSYMNQKEEIGLTERVDKFGTGEDVVEAVIKIQDASEAYSASGGCIFGFWFIHKLQPWIDGLNGITGRSYSVESFMEAGQRIVNMKREFNTKCGISVKDDTYGSRFYTPLEKGGSKKNVPPLDDLLQTYYRKRNWNEKGIPNI